MVTDLDGHVSEMQDAKCFLIGMKPMHTPVKMADGTRGWGTESSPATSRADGYDCGLDVLDEMDAVPAMLELLLILGVLVAIAIVVLT